MGKESLIALVAWVVIGVVFFLSRIRHNKSLDDEQIDRLVLGDTRPAVTRFGERARMRREGRIPTAE